MSSENYSLNKLIEITKLWGDRGEINQRTAKNMCDASRRILGVLDEHESKDLRNIDIEDAARRFANINAQVKSATVKDYKNRTEKSVEMFIRYVQDPLKWRPNVAHRKGGTAKQASPAQFKRKKVAPVTTKENPKAPEPEMKKDIPDNRMTIPFPLRPDSVIEIVGLPTDIKSSEIQRLTTFLSALAVDQ